MESSYVGVISYNGIVGSVADNETKVAVGTPDKLAGYVLIILIILSVGVMKVFVGSVSTDGGQVWVLEIDFFEIDWFGCSGHL